MDPEVVIPRFGHFVEIDSKPCVVPGGWFLQETPKVYVTFPPLSIAKIPLGRFIVANLTGNVSSEAKVLVFIYSSHQICLVPRFQDEPGYIGDFNQNPPVTIDSEPFVYLSLGLRDNLFCCYRKQTVTATTPTTVSLPVQLRPPRGSPWRRDRAKVN